MGRKKETGQSCINRVSDRGVQTLDALDVQNGVLTQHRTYLLLTIVWRRLVSGLMNWEFWRLPPTFRASPVRDSSFSVFDFPNVVHD